MHLRVKGKSHKDQWNTDPEPPLTLQSNPPTTRMVPHPMRPETDLGMPPLPKQNLEQDNGQWQIPGQGSAAKFSPFQDHPILPKKEL